MRAVDNSNIVPRAFVEKVMKLARDNQIPAQFGVTGGGNDGSAFVCYGSIDVALGCRCAIRTRLRRWSIRATWTR